MPAPALDHCPPVLPAACSFLAPPGWLRSEAHQLDVIVNRLGHAHHVAHDALLPALLGNRVRRRVAAVAANHVQLRGASREGTEVSECALFGAWTT